MRKSALASFLMVGGFALSAQAAFVGDLIDYQGGLNKVFTSGLAGVYDEYKKQKSGYQWDGLNVNDIVVVVLKATKVVSSKAPGGVADPLYEGELTKYLALQIASKGSNYYTFKAGTSDGWDPFGKLKNGEVMGIWLEGQKDFTTGSPIFGIKDGNRGNEADMATDGSLFATFGLDSQAFRGYFSEFSLTLRGGLDVNENPLGLYWLGVPNPLGGTADLAIHNLFLATDATSNTDWDFFASDAEEFRVTPEPGTMTALLAMGGAAGLGLALRRRKES
jgi:hypothetical protein